MRLIKEEVLLDIGDFRSTPEYLTISTDIRNAIAKVVWPEDALDFTIHPEKQANGVDIIKKAFVKHLKGMGWALEHRLNLGATLKTPGGLDATKLVEDKYFAVEWETGNISSSHRALNKMALGILRGTLIGGALILPTRKLYFYLTDRIGNFEELEPYFDVWRNLKIDRPKGLLSVIAIEHDNISSEIAKLTKRTDGRALR